jgi:hypothetical protein
MTCHSPKHTFRPTGTLSISFDPVGVSSVDTDASRARLR